MPKLPSKSAESKECTEIPRWRRIEIMREKAQLHEALGDIDFDEDFDELDEEVFGSDEEYLSFHKHAGDIEDDLEGKGDDDDSGDDQDDEFDDSDDDLDEDFDESDDDPDDDFNDFDED